MFELTVNAQVINAVTAFVLGFFWTAGCWVFNRIVSRANTSK
jgi:hypothetical protein